MHHCLEIEEVLERIIAGVAAYRHGLRALARLAATCQLFRDPALNLLWRELKGITPLVKCFPGEILNLDEHNRLTFTRPPRYSEWDRFLLHAARVRELQFMGKKDDCSEMVFRTLAINRPVIHVFPALKSIAWFSPAEPQAVCVPLFSGPSVTRVTIGRCWYGSRYNAPLDRVIPILHCVADSFPSTEHFIFQADVETRHGNPFPPTYFPTLSDAVSRMTHLTDFRCFDFSPYEVYGPNVQVISDSVLRGIIMHPTLQTLHCPLTPSNQLRTLIRQTAYDTVFPALQELHIHTKVLSVSFVEMIGALLRPKLKVLDLHTREQPVAQSLGTYFRTVAHNKSIERLWVGSQNCWSIQRNLDHSITEKMLQPLYQLHHLRSLKLDRIPLALNDESIMNMALAWPLVQVLELGCCMDQKAPGVTLHGLLPFAQHCKHLEYLCIVVDATSVPRTGLRRPGEGYCSHSMRHLHLGASPIRNMQAVALFLSDAFPFARGFSQSQVAKARQTDSRRTGMPKWQEVDNLVEILAEARLQERRFVYRSIIENIRR